MSAAGRKLSLAVGVLVTALLLPASVEGERTQAGNVIVAVNGAVRPDSLPRQRRAPVHFEIDGRIETADGTPLPRLTSVALAIAGRGALDVHGLPVCPRSRIANATTRQALRRCPGSLIGRGTIAAQIVAPHQAPFPLDARLLAFDGRGPHGEVAVWVHAYTPDPPVSIVLPFLVRPDGDRLRTTLTATVPRALGALPRIGRFDLDLGRRYAYRGEPRSLLSASCPAAPGFTGGFLTIVKATYSFADGRRPQVASVRGCQAR